MQNSESLDKSPRLQSIDVVRGIIMIIMALDHVREFFSYTSYRATDVTQASVMLFFTRWITHLCAPTFIFLSGISIFLYFKKVGSLKKTSMFLLGRGLWLILVEIFIISFILTQGYDLTLLEVIWAIGISMMLLAALTWLPRWAQISLALVMIIGHNALPAIEKVSADNILPALLHNTPFFIDKPPVLVAYTIVPWVGVMLLGYVVGVWFGYDRERRNKLLLISGTVALLLFFALRLLNMYGDPAPWSSQERGSVYTALSFMNVSKSPPSLLFLSVTLGIASFLLVAADHLSTGVKRICSTYGRVPFFFFILHLAVISLASYAWTYIAFGESVNLSFVSAKEWPTDYQPSLWRTYIVWMLLLICLYFPCLWYGKYKSTSKAWWVSYL
ncbi:MAG: heparan-alpha-glucosaminide N-acetyltransferase domain-containing protein [Bacteroidota bacterium]